MMSPLLVQNLLLAYSWLGGIGILLLVVGVLVLATFAYATVVSVELWNVGNRPLPSPRGQR